MPGFTGFVAILFSFNCQRREFTIKDKKKIEMLLTVQPTPTPTLGRLTVESRKNLYRAY